MFHVEHINLVYFLLVILIQYTRTGDKIFLFSPLRIDSIFDIICGVKGDKKMKVGMHRVIKYLDSDNYGQRWVVKSVFLVGFVDDYLKALYIRDTLNDCFGCELFRVERNQCSE